MKIGMGYDVHKLVENRDLILGGVKIPYELGLLGHSDADVLLHAIMDSLLGASALGDIGNAAAVVGLTAFDGDVVPAVFRHVEIPLNPLPCVAPGIAADVV